MKRYSLIYLETCLPDYFQGFGGTVIAASLPPRPRAGEVLQAVHADIRAIDLGEDVPDYAWQQLHDSADQLFAERDLRTSWCPSADDLSESYAYFGVQVEEEEE